MELSDAQVRPLLAAFVFLGATPAAAITYGSPDGSRHPAVGGLIGTFGSRPSRTAPVQRLDTADARAFLGQYVTLP
jgi:hypothetical protein